ncbi:MAG: C25 family cysteine peptidase [Candidatus Eisenbacteria bacterium]
MMRNGKGHFLAAALVLLVTGLAWADLQTIPLGGTESKVTLIDQTRDAMLFRVEIAEIAAMDVETEEGMFSRLLIPGFHSSQIVGSPELPMMNRLVEVPFGATTRIEILSTQSRTLSLADFGVNHPLMPAQPSMPKSADPETWPFIYNRDAYLTDRVGQELVRVDRQGRLRAVDIGRVEVSPVEYLPRSGEIVVSETIEFRVVFEGADHAAGADLKARTYSPFFEPVYSKLGGYDAFQHDTHPDVVGDVATYVIITPAEFEGLMQDFITWKTQRGFVVVTGVIGTPEVGTTAASIQSYIHGLYDNATPELPAPSFVLFVGDVAQCPTFFMSGDATDRPYCDVEGDLVPDIYYGRFSATNPSQLQAMLDKTLMYDQFTMPDPSYLEEVVMIAGVDAGYAPTHGNGQINYGTEHYFNAAHGILSHTYLYPASDAPTAPAEIVQHVSNGVSFINYTAHGSQTSWSDPAFTQSNINSLANAGEYCLAIGNCCLTSSFEVAECFAETFLRAANKGAVGYIGGSNSTYWNEDYWWGVGYHPASQIDGTAWPVESTGMGVYDGLFHEYGEPMENWYITNDAIVFCGNLAVMEAGSSLITYYWNIYNLMGDPSISTFLGVPEANPVVHQATLFTTTPSFTIEAVPNSYVGLSQNGVLYGAGTVDGTGSLDLTVLDLLNPGTAKLVVMAQDKEPYIVDLPVIVPATIIINPTVIDANVKTDVEVTVLEADGVTPKPGIAVWADGLGYTTMPKLTNAAGICTLTVDYPYGPTLDIVGKDPAETWNLFRESITVNAAALPTPDLWVTTGVGLADTFALNLPGMLNMTSGEPSAVLWAILPDGTEQSTILPSMSITPDELGVITGIIAASGYDLYGEDFPIIEAYGTLTGHVDANGSPAVGAVVRGYNTDENLVFQATTNASGDYDVGDDILVADYTIRVDFFGYLPYETPFFVNYGANVHDIFLVPAPAGVLTGTVTDTLGAPLYATVKVYRSDTMALYAQTMTDSTDGSYTTSSLPYFDYQVNIKSWHHKSVTIDITIDQPVVEKHFMLEPTSGDLLIIDDGAKFAYNAAKLDPKTGMVIEPGYAPADGKSAAELASDLQDVGYETTTETVGTTDPLTWMNYDLLIIASGDNTAPVADATFRANVEAFVAAGGHLLVEGGEVGYDAASYPGYPTFAANVLHSTDWNHDQSGNVTVADGSHYVMSVPNTILGPLTMTYAGYGDQDAMVATGDGVRIGSWTTYPTDASIIVYDPNPAPQGGQIVFFAWNYAAMDCAEQLPLLENAVEWLLTPEYGNCSISGDATLQDQSDHSGILVRAIPGGGSVITGPSGEYSFTGLFAGPYQIVASKDGWATVATDVTLSDGENATGIDLQLTPVGLTETCRQPNLAIPDNNPAGVSDVMTVNTGGATVSGVEVFVNITHTYIGDLIVRLTSPGGTTVVLHNRSGSSADNIYGWYPGTLTPAGDLADFIGDPCDGSWTLFVSDNASIDVGVLNAWCVRLTHNIVVSTDVADAESGAPKVLALKGNVPNPFNPTTTIHFDLPVRTDVRLSVYEISGRRVTTLASGSMDAGSHQVVWMGRDDEGRPVSSGVYFYRLEAGEKTLTKKMVLLK